MCTSKEIFNCIFIVNNKEINNNNNTDDDDDNNNNNNNNDNNNNNLTLQILNLPIFRNRLSLL